MSPTPDYVHSICAYGDNQYHMWPPIGQFRTAVIYLPCTAEAGPAQPLDFRTLTGTEIVFSPIVSNTGKHPWKNEVPEWIEPWILCLMKNYLGLCWRMMGFSRGAAWGLEIRSRIKAFGLVLLVGPYFLPRRTDEEKKLIATGVLEDQNSCINTLMCAYGDQDPWKPDTSLVELMDQFRTAMFLDCGHDASKQRAIDRYWGCLAQI